VLRFLFIVAPKKVGHEFPKGWEPK